MYLDALSQVHTFNCSVGTAFVPNMSLLSKSSQELVQGGPSQTTWGPLKLSL